MTHFRRPSLYLVLLAAAFILAIPLVTYAYQCNFYSDAGLAYFAGYGYVCAGYGNGCTECWDSSSGEGCAEQGFHDCIGEEFQN